MSKISYIYICIIYYCNIYIIHCSFSVEGDKWRSDLIVDQRCLGSFQEITNFLPSLAQIFFLNTIFVSWKPYVPREPWRDPSNRRLHEHGIYIRQIDDRFSKKPIFKKAAFSKMDVSLVSIGVAKPGFGFEKTDIVDKFNRFAFPGFIQRSHL